MLKFRWPRLRYQLGGGILFGILLPLILMLFWQPAAFSNAGFYYTVAFCLGSNFVGFLTWKQIDRFPNASAGTYVVWSFVPVFLACMVVMLMLRIPYTRSFFLLSIVLCLAWYLLVQELIRRFQRTSFAVIPGGNVEQLTGLAGIDWQKLKMPFKNTDDVLSDLLRRAASVGGNVHLAGFVVDLRHDHPPDTERLIAEVTLRGIPVYNYKSIMENLTGRVKVDRLSETNFGSVLPDVTYLKFKVYLDFLFTVLILPVLLLVIAVIALMIAVVDGRPVLFKQQRTGYQGRPFLAYKFRTMRHRTDDKVVNPGDSTKATNGLSDMSQTDFETSEGLDDVTNIKPEITLPDDNRITKLGRFLRKSRLDELPQALNIIMGEMSWIGPRPEAISLSEEYAEKIPYYGYRHAVRPGITGWAQVNLGHVTDIDQINQKLGYDFYYIKNISMWLDIIIVIKTFKVMLTGKGAK